jgi:CheY-like chemotaxis protein
MPEAQTVLLVEDDNSLRTVLHDKLTAEGFNVLEAQDGKIGLDLAIEHHPNVILLDIFMPRMDGISMMTQLRQTDPWGKHAKVIVLSNSTDIQTISRATGLGATDFLIKSEWSLDDIVAKIRERAAL